MTGLQTTENFINSIFIPKNKKYTLDLNKNFKVSGLFQKKFFEVDIRRHFFIDQKPTFLCLSQPMT